MLKRLLFGALLLLVSTFQPLRADPTDLQATTAGVAVDQIVIQVDNPSTTAESAGIQVTVKVEGGSTEVLTIPTVTVEASSTVLVSARASAPIVQIIDDPQPF